MLAVEGREVLPQGSLYRIQTSYSFNTRVCASKNVDIGGVNTEKTNGGQRARHLSADLENKLPCRHYIYSNETELQKKVKHIKSTAEFKRTCYVRCLASAFSSVQFIDSMPQLQDRMREQICGQWKRTKRHQSALTIALKLGLEKQ